jgi:hypothetical protein
MPHQVRAASFTGRVSWATEMHESALALAEPEGSVQGFSHICGGVGQGDIPWCLWCLFEAEIGSIHAEQLKQLQQRRP